MHNGSEFLLGTALEREKVKNRDLYERIDRVIDMLESKSVFPSDLDLMIDILKGKEQEDAMEQMYEMIVTLTDGEVVYKAIVNAAACEWAVTQLERQYPMAHFDTRKLVY